MNDNKITVIDEDDSDVWAYHLEMERCQLEEKPEAHMDTREILERLQRASAILKDCDTRLEYLAFMIDDQAQKIKQNNLKFQEALKVKSRAILKSLK
tara:strand:- start:164 stop:454 length:291 start_codon:yes stop_codon:yes gene_type:complete